MDGLNEEDRARYLIARAVARIEHAKTEIVRIKNCA
jgi:hypothetical protein